MGVAIRKHFFAQSSLWGWNTLTSLSRRLWLSISLYPSDAALLLLIHVVLWLTVKHWFALRHLAVNQFGRFLFCFFLSPRVCDHPTRLSRETASVVNAVLGFDACVTRRSSWLGRIKWGVTRPAVILKEVPISQASFYSQQSRTRWSNWGCSLKLVKLYVCHHCSLPALLNITRSQKQ